MGSDPIGAVTHEVPMSSELQKASKDAETARNRLELVAHKTLVSSAPPISQIATHS
jgi:hypothetical protein